MRFSQKDFVPVTFWGGFLGYSSCGRLSLKITWAALCFLLNIHAAIKALDLGLAVQSKHPKTHWTGTNLGVCFLKKVSGLLKTKNTASAL